MRSRQALSIIVLGAVSLFLSCGGGGAVSSTPTTPTTGTPSGAPTVVSISPTATSGGSTPDCGAAWLASLEQLSRLSPTEKVDDIQIVSWNDYESGSQIEAGIDNCVSITPSITGTTLTWEALGNTATVDHFAVYASADGENLTQLAQVPTTSRSLDLQNAALTANTEYTFFVQAVGKPSVLNKVSQPVKYRKSPAPTPNQPPVPALSVSPTSGTAPLTVTASTSGSTDPDGTIAMATIDFGDGSVINAASGSHTYNSAGTFTVTATVTDNAGATAAPWKTVVVNADAATSAGALLSLAVFPKAVITTRGSYQTVTAIVNGVDDKTVTWSAPDGGSIIGTNPCVVNEPCTVALYSTVAGTYHLTATSNANTAVSATATITVTESPTPNSGHPRLLVTSDMLAGLRAKALDTNPLYTAIKNEANIRLTTLNSTWTWTCNGGTGLPSGDESSSSPYREGTAKYFAFMSMIAPTQAERDFWGCRGRDVFLYVASKVNDGTIVVNSGNRWSDKVDAFALTPDWLLAGGYLSGTELATTRQYLMKIAAGALSNSYGHKAPIGAAYNSSAMFDTNSVWDYSGLRMNGNNYTHSRILDLIAAGLTFDDTEANDPTLANCAGDRYTVCANGTANSLRAYWRYAVGGMLYQDWALLEDPVVSWKAYHAAYGNLPSQPTCKAPQTGTAVPCFGGGRGGESVEGSWYDYSLYRLRYALNAIHTAGMDDPILYGPQISLANSSWWDLLTIAGNSFLTGRYNHSAKSVTNPDRWSYLTTGDSNTYYRVPVAFQTHAALLTQDAYTGRTDRTDTLLWPILNTPIGGISSFLSTLANDYGRDNGFDLFIALPAGDPTSAPPSDPRPSLPTEWYAAGNQHLIVRSGWTANDVLFSYYCPNASADHEHSFCGRFDIFSKGEYITKGRTEFNDYNNAMTAADQSNVASYHNKSIGACADTGCVMYKSFVAGGQFWHGEQGGFSTLRHSELPTYATAIVDQTPFYNTSSTASYPGINDVSHASRSLVYLRGSNQVVYYDRGTTGSARPKKLRLVTTGALTMNGSTASWLTRSGNQKAYFTSLLPQEAAVADAGAYSGESSEQQADWEPYTRVVVDAGTVTSTNFLSVLEWGASSLVKSTTTLVQSSSGTLYDGAKVGSSLVMFKRNWNDSFVGLTYSVSSDTNHYVADLVPNRTYTVVTGGHTVQLTSDRAGVLAFVTSDQGEVEIR